jgi:hypothetical protein
VGGLIIPTGDWIRSDRRISPFAGGNLLCRHGNGSHRMEMREDFSSASANHRMARHPHVSLQRD